MDNIPGMMTCARQRVTNGELRYAAASRFMKEIPRELLEMNVTPEKTERVERIAPHDRAAAARAFDEPPRAFSPGFKKRAVSSLKKGADIVKVKPDYNVGERVRHFKFGEGTVLSIVEGERDYEVTVDFDGVGTRKMFAGFAKLKKL